MRTKPCPTCTNDPRYALPHDDDCPQCLGKGTVVSENQAPHWTTALKAQNKQLVERIHALKVYLTASKFTTESGNLTGYVNVNDVLLRLND